MPPPPQTSEVEVIEKQKDEQVRKNRNENMRFVFETILDNWMANNPTTSTKAAVASTLLSNIYQHSQQTTSSTTIVTPQPTQTPTSLSEIQLSQQHSAGGPILHNN